MFLSWHVVTWIGNISLDKGLIYLCWAETFWEAQIFSLHVKVLKHDRSRIRLGTFVLLRWTFSFCMPAHHLLLSLPLAPRHIEPILSAFLKTCYLEIIWDLQKSCKNNEEPSHTLHPASPNVNLLLNPSAVWYMVSPEPIFFTISCPKDLARVRIQPRHDLSLTFKELAIQ